MDTEHKKLTSSLSKKYLAILTASLLVFVSTLITLNQSSILTSTNYVDHPTDHHHRLTHILASSKTTLDSINALMQQQIALNSNWTDSSLFCNNSLSYSQCSALQAADAVNNAVLDIEGTSTSFRCLAGSCAEVGYLWDYFWTFKLRLSFIDYLYIEYQSSSNASSTLIVPSLAIESFSLTAVTPLSSSWTTSFINNTLVLSKLYQQQSNITISLVFSTSSLLSRHGIMLSDYDFTLPSHPRQDQDDQFYVQSILNYLKILLLIVLLVICFLMILRVQELITQWGQVNFQNLEALDSLYRYQLNCIFTGKQTHNSTILCQSAMSDFYEDLSELIDTTYTSLTVLPVEEEKEDSFKFIPLLEKIKEKESREMRKYQEERNHELADIKYQIKGAVSEITDHVAGKIKETYTKARELHLTRAFFYYGYLCLLETTTRFEERLRESSTALPDAVTSLFRYMNQTLNSSNIMFPFKFAGAFPKLIERQLIMKLHFHLHQKYLSNFKELDFGLTHCRKLNLEKEVHYLQESIDNKKYIFMTYLK